MRWSVIIGLLGALAAWSATCPTGYNYAVPITIHGAQIGSGTQSDFSHMVCFNGSTSPCNNSGLVLSDLKTVTNSGKVQHTVTATVPFSHTIPADLVFTDGTSPIPFEVQGYSATTGELHAWVKQSVTGGTDSVIYACYGNTAVTTDQSTPQSTWDGYSDGVWHDLTVGHDSTANGNDLTAAGSGSISSASGPFGTAASFPGTAFLQKGSGAVYPTGDSAFTVAAWVKPSLTSGFNNLVSMGHDNGSKGGHWLASGSDYSADFGSGFGSVSAGMTVDTNWHYVVETFDSSHIHKIYVDGVFRAQHAFDSGIAVVLPDNLRIGAYTDDNSNYLWHGLTAEVRVVHAARSAAWIATENVNQGAPATYYSVGTVITLGTPPPPTGKGQVIIF